MFEVVRVLIARVKFKGLDKLLRNSWTKYGQFKEMCVAVDYN